MLKAPALAPSVQASGSPSKESKPYQVASGVSSAKWLIEFALVDAELQMQAVLVADLLQHGAMQRQPGLVARGVAQMLLLERRRRRGIAEPRHQVDIGEHQLDQLAHLAARELADALLGIRQALPHPDRQPAAHSSGASTIGS